MLVSHRPNLAVTVAAVLLAVAVGVGVPVGLSTRHHPTSATGTTAGLEGASGRTGPAAAGTPNGSEQVTAGGSAASEGGPRRHSSGTRETPPGETPRTASGTSRTATGLVAPATRTQIGRGRVVPGFPSALAPVPASRVTSSSVSPAGRRAQVALTATVGVTPDAVVTHFRSTLRARGLRDDVVDAVPGSRAVRFSSGADVVVLTVRPRGAGSAYSLVGVLPTRGGRS